MRKKITTAILGSTLIAPTLWMIYLLLVGWLNFDGILKILINPYLIICMTIHIVSTRYILLKKLKQIDIYLAEENYEMSQKNIFLIPILFLFLTFVYALYTTPAALIQLDISSHYYVVVSCFGPCMLSLIHI